MNMRHLKDTHHKDIECKIFIKLEISRISVFVDVFKSYYIPLLPPPPLPPSPFSLLPPSLLPLS